MWFDPAQLAKTKPRPPATFATSATFQTQEPIQGPKVAIVAKVASLPSQKTDTRSRWWLLHYPDREPVETASFPPATHAEILERHPEAIAAEPFESATLEPARVCSTCSNVTGRGGCGEPVAAGLSDVVGVIRYSPDQGATCSAWLARLDPDLERRILAMAKRWNYSSDDLALSLAGARSDSDGWLALLEAFEERAAIMEFDGGMTRVEAERAALDCWTSWCPEDTGSGEGINGFVHFKVGIRRILAAI